LFPEVLNKPTPIHLCLTYLDIVTIASSTAFPYPMQPLPLPVICLIEVLFRTTYSQSSNTKAYIFPPLHFLHYKLNKPDVASMSFKKCWFQKRPFLILIVGAAALRRRFACSYPPKRWASCGVTGGPFAGSVSSLMQTRVATAGLADEAVPLIMFLYV
jgi:hypothetical protein